MCLGLLDSFEVWYAEDYEKLVEETDEIMNILEEIEF